MNPGIEIRRMTIADVTPVMEMAGDLEHVPRWSRGSWIRAVEAAHVSLVAADAAGIHGFAVASLIAGHAELETIAVLPASRRRGIARGLMASLINELRLAGSEELWLEVRVSNEPAICLYRAFGFDATGVRPRYYSGPVEDALLMQTSLA